MYDVVPGALQRLREADIVSMAGLTAASLGQEYSRIGAVFAAKRRGARLSGIVEVSNTLHSQAASTANDSKRTEHAALSIPGRFTVEVEIRDRISCAFTCTCNQSSARPQFQSQSSVVCPHAAALLYHWLAHPMSFTTSPPASAHAVPLPFEQQAASSPLAEEQIGNTMLEEKQIRPLEQAKQMPALPNLLPLSNTVEILTQSGLSELRAMAREYDIATNGLSKHQLAEAIVDVLKQPEAIRRVVATLEKQQRQLLAALTLAGGSMNDEDLRGLFERFSLGGPGQLQNMLRILQGKALIVRAALNNSLQQRIGLSGSTLDICWYVLSEVRTALHVTLPITPFTIETGNEHDTDSPKVQHVEPYTLLTDLLLVARALDGKRLERDERSSEDNGNTSAIGRSLNPLPVEGSIAIPPPSGTPSTSLLKSLQAVVPRSLPFLRFAFRVLRLADILYFETDANDAGESSYAFGNDALHLAYDSSRQSEVPTFRAMRQNKPGHDARMPILHVLPNAAALLLGLTRAEVAHELFTHWLNQPNYDELFDLQEEGLRLRCRATPLNQPALRAGELEAENREARQALVALLSQAPSGQWINFTAFARFVYRLNPTFLQKRQRQFSSPHWWIEQEEGHPLRPTQFSDWMRAEGRYLAQLLQGPLHWWGASDMVLSSDERLLAFRLTPLAESFLGEMPVGAQFIAPGTHLSEILSIADVLESGDLLIPCTFAHWPLIELIERFAEARGVHAAQLCYRLTPKSLNEAFSRGESPAALLELLHRSAEYQHTIAPDSPLAVLLTQLENRIASYGRVRLYTDTSLLEAADQLVLRELSATTSLDEQIVQPIHPTLLILKKQAIERLIDELKRRGQVPLLHDSVETQFTALEAEEQYGTK